jgi:L-aspartate oxidase
MSLRAAGPLIIVGGGIAGMVAALELAPLPVVLLLRGRLGEDGATALAQGGLAAALGPGDHPRQHAADTLVAGAGRCDTAAVRHLTRAAPAAIRWLAAKGVDFDREGALWALGREGGHRRSRIVHAGGDATGVHVSRALSAALRRAGHVVVVQNAEVDALLVGYDRHVAGVRVREVGGHAYRLPGAGVLLATGGIGGLFASSTGPRDLDGCGLALALAAGAQLRDLEYVQFHPTALRLGSGHQAPLPLVTEALRGAGAVLRGADGEPLMSGRHPSGDLAPRDVVARVVASTDSAWLDATGLELEWKARFPTVLAIAAKYGLDPSKDWLPVEVAPHFHMGGIAASLDGATSVPGLSAIGEVACTRIHGANRLASNSLLEGIVAGRMAAARLMRESRSTGGPTRLAPAGDPVSGSSKQSLRQTLSEALGPEREPEVVSTALEKIDADSRQGRVARALLTAAAANTHRIGAHWPRIEAIRAFS